MRTTTFVSVSLLAFALAKPAGAQTTSETTTTVTAEPSYPPAPSSPSAEAYPRLDERTALMVGKDRLKLGILAFEYGILERLSVGTTPPVWALRAFKSVLVPNLFVKGQIIDRDPFWVSAVIAGYYADISKGQASGQLLDIPLSLFASFRAQKHVYLHAEGAYIFVRGFGDGDLSRADIGGTAAARAGQAQLLAEFRILDWFSLTALGRYQFYSSTLTVSGSGMSDASTTASIDAEVVPRTQHPWEVIGGVAILLKHVHIIAGAGYGNYFVPGLEIPTQKRGFVPDGSLSVLFTL
jgi:hypothetical protein